MPVYKKLIIGFIGFLLILGIANFGLNFWIDQKLPKIISANNESPYSITYKNLDVALWSGNIWATDINVVPKSALKDTINKAGMYSEIKSVEVKDFKIWNLLFNDKLKARSIIINKPIVVLYKKNQKAINKTKSFRSAVVDPFQKLITVSDIYLNNGEFKILYVKNNKSILSAENINVQLEGITFTEQTLQNNIPFAYKKYSFECSNIYYSPKRFHHLSMGKLVTTNKGLKITKLAFVPEYNRKQFVKTIAKEKDLYTVNADSLRIKNVDWGFRKELFFFNCSTVIMDRVSANIYRSKMPEDDLKKKKLYNKLLREIPFPLKIDTLLVRNSKVVYEEELDTEKGPGVVTLDRFNMKALSIQSAYGQKKLADSKIKINCRIMKESPLTVDWRFNVLDKSDGFTIRGKITNFDTAKLFPFARPYMDATLTGVFDELSFNFSGNDKVNNGEFGLKYHDLKVSLYRKNKPEKKNKLKSFIANLLVKNDSNGKVATTKIDVERIPEKSFYNFLWRSVVEGLKKIVM